LVVRWFGGEGFGWSGWYCTEELRSYPVVKLNGIELFLKQSFSIEEEGECVEVKGRGG
jgi:hypothetical protein